MASPILPFRWFGQNLLKSNEMLVLSLINNIKYPYHFFLPVFFALWSVTFCNNVLQLRSGFVKSLGEVLKVTSQHCQRSKHACYEARLVLSGASCWVGARQKQQSPWRTERLSGPADDQCLARDHVEALKWLSAQPPFTQRTENVAGANISTKTSDSF